MTDWIPGLGAELRVKAEALAERPAKRSVPRRTGVVISVGVLALTSGAYAAQSLWRPQLGDGSADAPVASPAEPAAGLLASFEVLRREQTDADRSAEAAYALTFAGDEVESVNTNYVRVLGNNAEGQPVVLISQTSREDGEQLCLWVRSPEYAGGQVCNTVDNVLSGGLVIGRGTDNGELSIAGLVADGAQSVQVGESEQRASVSGNFFKTVASEQEVGNLDVRSFGADGRVVRGAEPYEVNLTPTAEQDAALRRQLSRYVVGNGYKAGDYIDVAYGLCSLIGSDPRPTQTQLENETIQRYRDAGVEGFDRSDAALMLENVRLAYCQR